MTNAYQERRLGRFFVPFDDWHDPEKASVILREVVPTRVEALFHSMSFDIIGYSPQFEPAPMNMFIPQYALALMWRGRGEDMKLVAEFTR